MIDCIGLLLVKEHVCLRITTCLLHRQQQIIVAAMRVPVSHVHVKQDGIGVRVRCQVSTFALTFCPGLRYVDWIWKQNKDVASLSGPDPVSR